MNKFIVKAIFLLLVSLSAQSQEIEMFTDWEKAKATATRENKKILIVLTGSEWCAPCKKMDRNVIHHPEFRKYASENLVVFLVDLPGGGLVINSKVYQDYEKFKHQYQTNALPSLILTESDGTKLAVLKGKMFNLDNVMRQLR